VNPDRRRAADQLYAVSHAHDQQTEDRLERFRNLEPVTAQLLGVLVRACGARRVLELGTSNGYSTLWLADAVEATGGELVSVDIDAARSAMARAALAEAGLVELVELRTEDAERALRESEDGAWDLIFLDSERPAYTGYLPDLLRTLRPGGMLAIDNVISHEHELTEFTALIEAEPGLAQTVVAIGAGLRLVVRDRGT
jgi:predicted O-methyltransferase YrrM